MNVLRIRRERPSPRPSPVRLRSLRAGVPGEGGRGFTLVEMIAALVIATILMGGVLAVASTLARDRVRVEAHARLGGGAGVMELVQYDLSNAMVVIGAAGEGRLELVGASGVDEKTLTHNGRLCRVVYRLARAGRGNVLIREQAYLDDPIRVDAWSEIVAVDVRRFGMTALSRDDGIVKLSEEVEERIKLITKAPAVGRVARAPSRCRVRVEMGAVVVDREMVVR